MADKPIPAKKSRKERAVKQRKQQRIRDISLIASGVLIIAAFVWLILGNTKVQNVTPPRVGYALGDFSLKDINGKTVHLADYKGKPVLINAWATWR